MSQYILYPAASGGNQIAEYPTFASFPATASDGAFALALDTDKLYVFNAGSMTWVVIGGPGAALGIGTIDSTTASANGAVISGNNLIMQSATGSVPGLVNNAGQTFSGVKNFSSNIFAANLSGTNSGDVTLGTASGLSLSGQILSLALSSTSTTGALSSTDWNTFNSKQSTLTLGNLTDAGTDGIVITGGAAAVIGSGTSIAQHVADATHNGYLSSTDWSTFNSKQSTITIGALDAQAVNANGLALVSNVLSSQSADGTHPGMVNITTQTFAGVKTFSGGINAGGNQITNVTDPTVAQAAATKNYVDMAVAALQPLTSVYAASTTNLPGTYINGVAGVGATFTTTSTTTPFTIDGATPPVGSRILIKDQSSGFQNGVYGFTTAPVAGVSGAVFTRTFDYDTAGDMNAAGLIPVINGTTNALSSWQQVAAITTVGTDSLVFTEFTANPSLYLLKANNLSDVASKTASFNNLSPMTTGGDLIYGGASGAGTRLANGGSGQVLTSAGTTLPPTWQTPTAGTVTTVSVVSANGLAGTVATATSTPAITLSTTITGILKGNGTAISAAAAGTDYQAAGNYITALSGDVVAAGPGSAAATIQANVVANSKLAQMAAHTYKGNNTGSTANAADITSTQLTADLNTFTSGLQGLVPASGGGTTNFLRADGTFAAPSGGSSTLAITSKTTTYTLSNSDDVVQVSASSAWNLTLQDATTATAKVYRILRTDNSIANQISLLTTSAQTVNGYASNAIKISTQWEGLDLIPNGTNWIMVQHHTHTTSTSITLTYNGLGSVVGPSAWLERRGNIARIRGYVQSSAVTATTFGISLPTGLVIDSTKFSAVTTFVGELNQMTTASTNIWSGGAAYTLFYDGSTTNQVFVASRVVTQAFEKRAANATINNNDPISFWFEIPIVGWVE